MALFLFSCYRHVQTYRKTFKKLLYSFSHHNKSCFIRFCYSNTNGNFSNPPWRIVFFGSDDFALKSLQALCSKLRTGTLISKLDVVTSAAEDWHQRKNEVYRFAESEKLKIYGWPIDISCIHNKYDLGIVVSFGHLIPAKIINCFPLGILNVHGSLLPRWRGAAPIIHAVLNGDSITGITIMKIHPDKFDIGGIIRQYSVAIKAHETAAQLTDRLAIIGAQILMECVRNLPRSVQFVSPQPTEGVSYAKKITPSMAMVDWNSKSACDVYNQYKALSHLFPLKTYWFGKSVKLFELQLDEIVEMNPENMKNLKDSPNSEEIFPGLVEHSKKRKTLRVQCRDGKWILIKKVQVFGKHVMSPSQFYNGYLSKVNNSLERRFSGTES